MGGIYVESKICNLVEAFGFRLIKNLPYKDYNIVITNRGQFALKKVDCQAWEIAFIHNLKQYLINNGFSNIDKYLTVKESPYVELEGDYYVMTELIEGRKYSLKTSVQLRQSSRALAELHKASQGYYYKVKGRIRANIGKLQGEYLEKCQDFIYIKNLVRMKKKKEEIDILFLEHADMLYDMSIESVGMIQNNGYFELCEEESREKYICHNDYKHNNIIVGKDGKLNIINFEKCKFELRCVDIAKFIVATISSLNWDFKSALKILEAYNDVIQIEEREYKLMASMIQFPHSIWKIATEYYYQEPTPFNKRYYVKLKKNIKKMPYKIEFLKKYKKRFI